MSPGSHLPSGTVPNRFGRCFCCAEVSPGDPHPRKAKGAIRPSVVGLNPPPTPAGAKAPRRLLTSSLAPIKRACWSLAPRLKRTKSDRNSVGFCCQPLEKISNRSHTRNRFHHSNLLIRYNCRFPIHPSNRLTSSRPRYQMTYL